MAACGQWVYDERKRVRAACEDTSRIVARWPKWKQNILENSSSPTVKTPRQVIIIEVYQ